MMMKSSIMIDDTNKTLYRFLMNCLSLMSLVRRLALVAHHHLHQLIGVGMEVNMLAQHLS